MQFMNLEILNHFTVGWLSCQMLEPTLNLENYKYVYLLKSGLSLGEIYNLCFLPQKL